MKLKFISFFLIVFFLFSSCAKNEYQLNILSHENVFNLRVRLADSPNLMKKGLMGRKRLSENEGMFFVYKNRHNPQMWMKGMLIPIDILFIKEDFSICHIEKNIPPCNLKNLDNCPRYKSSQISSYVLELPAGYVDSHHILEGDQIEFIENSISL